LVTLNDEPDKLDNGRRNFPALTGIPIKSAAFRRSGWRSAYRDFFQLPAQTARYDAQIVAREKR
jgi:hypothetical protein